MSGGHGESKKDRQEDPLPAVSSQPSSIEILPPEIANQARFQEADGVDHVAELIQLLDGLTQRAIRQLEELPDQLLQLGDGGGDVSRVHALDAVVGDPQAGQPVARGAGAVFQAVAVAGLAAGGLPLEGRGGRRGRLDGWAAAGGVLQRAGETADLAQAFEAQECGQVGEGGAPGEKAGGGGVTQGFGGDAGRVQTGRGGIGLEGQAGGIGLQRAGLPIARVPAGLWPRFSGEERGNRRAGWRPGDQSLAGRHGQPARRHPGRGG